MCGHYLQWQTLCKTGAKTKTQHQKFAHKTYQPHPNLKAKSFSLSLLITLDVINGSRYVWSMIRSFKDKETEKIFRGQFSRKIPQDIQRIAARKLEQINAATVLDTLRVPPGNRLEALKHDRRGQHSIRVNDQWRVCFVWRDDNAFDVEIVDYH